MYGGPTPRNTFVFLRFKTLVRLGLERKSIPAADSTFIKGQTTIDLVIEHQCPQCGAPITLVETDRLLACAFCRVKSYLMSQLFYRYMLPHRAPAGKQLVYVPYWRFKGMIFSSLAGGVAHTFMDASRQALKSAHFPVSLGLRSQALKLQFVTPDTPGEFLQPRIPYKAVLDLFMRKANAAITGPLFTQAHIGESISLIFAPFYVEERVYDAVLNEPLPPAGDPGEILSFESRRPDWEIRFVATLCPACGWDLEGERNSHALTCNNCNSVWYPGRKKLRQIRFAHLPGDFGKMVYLPFWRIRARVTGIELDTYADLIRVANLPRAVRPEHAARPFRFWSPAFKVRPRTFLNLVKKTTLVQPGQKASALLPKGPLYPVSLPVSEALETLKIIMAGFVKPPGKRLPGLADLEVEPQSHLLVYIPFRQGHHDYVNPDLNLAVNRNQLSLAGNL